MSLKITIGCCNHLFGEGIKRLLLEECDLGADSIITASSSTTNPNDIAIICNNALYIRSLLC